MSTDREAVQRWIEGCRELAKSLELDGIAIGANKGDVLRVCSMHREDRPAEGVAFADAAHAMLGAIGRHFELEGVVGAPSMETVGHA